MSLDGIVVSSIVYELSNSIVEGKIDKVYQPEKDEIILNIRNKGSNYKLLISASSNHPRMYLTGVAKSNPTAPPMFCMLLRKHLHGGRIIGIRQPSLERIIVLEVENYDELGILSTKELIVEIMGRHSNIILVEKNTQKVIDSIKRVPEDISSVRQVLPGLNYSLPPVGNKLDTFSVNEIIFHSKLNESEGNTLVYKAIYSSFIGFSPLVAREICFLSNIDDRMKINDLDTNAVKSIYKNFIKIISTVREHKYSPVLVKANNGYEMVDFYAIDISYFGNLPKTYFKSISELLEEYYFARDNVDRINQKSSELRKIVTTKLERAYHKLEKLNDELNDASKRDKYRIYGDLLTSNIYKLKKGNESIEVENYFSETPEILTIKLDPRLTPSQNVQKFYKKYNKLKNAFILVNEQIVKTKEEIDYLEQIIVSMDNCVNYKELDEIKDELIKEGFIKDRAKNKKKSSNGPVSSPYHFISSDGYDIYVGKNNKQNDYLTLKLADKEDIWLHTKNIPGSHVIIKVRNNTIPEQTIIEAATLAAHYSKGKLSSNVPVDFAERKYVKKPNGAKPGMVIYDNNNTIYVTPDLESISKIKKVEK